MNIEKIKYLINKYNSLSAEVINNSRIAERYYANKNDILFKPSTIEKDEVDKSIRKADNRIPSSFYQLLVNQKASYLFTDPPIFNLGNKEATKQVRDILGNKFAKVCKDLCINASNSAIAWLHVWEDVNNNKLKYAVVDTKQIVPIFDDSLEENLLAVIRIYRDKLEFEDKEIIKYEYWDNTTCYVYASGSDGDLNSIEPWEEFNHNFNAVPFIAFKNNNIGASDLSNIKGLIDTYDRTYSGFANDLEDIQEVIFILTNYQGESLSEFLEGIKQYKAVKLESNGADDKSGLSTLSIDIPVEARDKLLSMTRKAIFEQGQGVDPDPSNFGNSSGVALRFMYSLLELKAGLMETEFKLSFEKLIEIICNHEKINYDFIEQIWTRTAITNSTELVDMANKSSSIISKKTLLSNHPWVTDPDLEIKQLKEDNNNNNNNNNNI